MKIKRTSFQEIAECLVESIVEGYKQCPDSENKTFEEVADWCGKHVLLTEEQEPNENK